MSAFPKEKKTAQIGKNSDTPPKTNIEPENHPVEKENHLPNLHFLGSILFFRGVAQNSSSKTRGFSKFHLKVSPISQSSTYALANHSLSKHRMALRCCSPELWRWHWKSFDARTSANSSQHSGWCMRSSMRNWEIFFKDWLTPICWKMWEILQCEVNAPVNETGSWYCWLWMSMSFGSKSTLFKLCVKISSFRAWWSIPISSVFLPWNWMRATSVFSIAKLGTFPVAWSSHYNTKRAVDTMTITITTQPFQKLYPKIHPFSNLTWQWKIIWY